MRKRSNAGHGWVGAAGFLAYDVAVGGGVVGMMAATDELAFQFGLFGGETAYPGGAVAGDVATRWVPFAERNLRLGLMAGAAHFDNDYEQMSFVMTGVVLEAGAEHFRFDASIPFTVTEWRNDGVYVLAPFQAAETVPGFGFTHRFDERHRLRLGGLVPNLTYQYARERFFLDVGVIVVAPLVRTGWVF